MPWSALSARCATSIRGAGEGLARALPRHDREGADGHSGRGPQPLALQECTLIHRIGELLLGDQIVLVVVSSAHREAAFEACHFIMDFLKPGRRSGKKELTAEGVQRWVEAKESDNTAAARWQA